jgi:hypothetical protein
VEWCGEDGRFNEHLEELVAFEIQNILQVGLATPDVDTGPLGTTWSSKNQDKPSTCQYARIVWFNVSEDWTSVLAQAEDTLGWWSD